MKIGLDCRSSFFSFGGVQYAPLNLILALHVPSVFIVILLCFGFGCWLPTKVPLVCSSIGLYGLGYCLRDWPFFAVGDSTGFAGKECGAEMSDLLLPG